MWWVAQCTGAFVHLYKNSRERVPVRHNKKGGGYYSLGRLFILFVFPQYCCIHSYYSLRLWAHSMCETVQSNVLLLFLGEKKDYNYNAHSKIGRSICWWRDEKKHAGEKVKKCLKSKQKQIEGNATHHRQRQLSSPSAVGEAELSGWWVSPTEGNVISTFQADPLQLLKRQILWRNKSVSLTN